MYQKKKLALFISHIYGDYQKELCRSIIKCATDFGYRTEVYATNDGENLGDYGIGENSILRIPNFEEFDGIVFASGTYADSTFMNTIAQHIKDNCHCPVIEISEYHPTFPSIAMENNQTFGELAEHLISKHQCKNLCYLGSSQEQFFSDKRALACEKAILSHGLTLPAEHILHIDESPDSYTEALKSFTNNYTSKPDAIICYNDRVALSFMQTALFAGYRIPEDFAITGCDYTNEGQSIIPPLTTITFPVAEVGKRAVTQLIRCIKGETIEPVSTVYAKPLFNGSCGCKQTEGISFLHHNQALTGRIKDLEDSMIASMRMSAAFSHIDDIDEGMDLLEKYIGLIDNCSEFYLCLYGNWNQISSHVLELTDATDELEEEYDENTILLKLAMKNGKRLPECTFSNRTLLPDYLRKDSASSYVVSPLFFEDRAFGYVALAYTDNDINYHFKLVHWIMNITQLLENICRAKNTKLLTGHLESIYMKDVLTGLYNHHGFDHFKETLLASIKPQEAVTAYLIDLDGLKTINDTFGHKEGDFALQVIGQAFENARSNRCICSRFSGDEFYILSVDEKKDAPEEFMEKVNNYLSNFNHLSNKPYNVSISAGYATFATGVIPSEEQINALFSQADTSMYQTKKTKHKVILKS